ncbi:AMP-binding protein [Corynebacterium sp. ES2715-CONJ3]|uniref:AMP-binding protein n=1 Tax=Corynebacterium sp. ES2715-CONJ3 TaxID=2974028 RepID=UPI002169D7AD|nr:AMP-binding protein [Corynebacterium sp. ES2715-CONJ3]MCS4491351.1 AMP-binding protein [Corynebacterium sp. ES2715-CONJ3]
MHSPTTYIALSPTQQSMWFAHMLDPTSAQYQTAELIIFDGEVDIDLLRTAITQCIQSVEVINAHYDSPHRAVLQPNPCQVTVVEAPVDYPRKFARTIMLTRLNGDLVGETLTAHWLFRDQDHRVYWLARFHHICCDGFFVNALIRWIADTYTAFVNHAHLPSSPFIPPDYVAAEFTLEPPTPSAATRDYWSATPLVTPPPLLEPAGDELMVSARATVAASARRSFMALAREYHAQELELLLASLAHYCGVLSGVTERISIGVPMMNRPLGQALVSQGPLVNVLGLDVDLHIPQPGIDINEVSKALSLLRAHSDISAAQLRALKGISDPYERFIGPHLNFRPFSPRFQFATIQALLETIAVGPINDCEFIIQSTPLAELEIIVLGRGSNNAHLVRDHAQRFAEFISTLDISGGPLFAGKSVATAHERSSIAHYQGDRRAIEYQTLGEMITAARKRYGQLDKLLGTFDLGGEDLRWLSAPEVWARVDRRCAALRSYGLQPGHIVVLHIERGMEFLLTVAALALMGVTWCPVDPTLPLARRTYMIDASGADVVMSATSLDHPIPTIRVTDSTCSAPTSPIRSPHAHPQCAYILFTSGSTGAPKAVANSQAGIVNRLSWMCEYYQITPEDIVLHKTPSSFDVSVWEYLLAFTHGIPTAIATPLAHKNPAVIASHLTLAHATICHFVPAALTSFLSFTQHPSKRDQWDAARFNLRALICSGEALEASLASRAQDFFDADIHNLYGPAEAAIDVTAHTFTPTDHLVPIGAPVWNTDIHIVDPYFAPLPPGFSGTVLIGGIQVGLGYIGREDLTAQHFITLPHLGPTTLYNTGDTAYWLNGELIYTGRADSQVKIRGQRVELAEIENTLSKLPEVLAVAVVIDHSHGDPKIVAYYIPADREVPELLDRHARSFLAEYMVPSFYIALDAFPMTPNGKLDTQALPAPVPEHTGGAIISLDPTEQAVHKAFEEVLGQRVNDADQSFFSLGGHSLSAVDLALKFPQLSVADIFAHPTISGLAKCLNYSTDAGGFDPVITLRPHHGGAAIFCFAPAGGLTWSYSPLAHLLEEYDRHSGSGIFGMQSLGILDTAHRATSIQAQARASLDKIRELWQIHHFSSVVLVGWSVGGVVAHEVACQLQHSWDGVAISGLYLLDAYPPQVWQSVPIPSEEELWAGVLAMAGLKRADDTPLSAAEIIAAMRDSHGVFSQLRDHEIDGIRTMVAHNASLMREHTAGFYSGQAVHYTAGLDRATRLPEITVSAWDHLIEHLECVEYPVNHPGMVGVEVLNDLAQRISH